MGEKVTDTERHFCVCGGDAIIVACCAVLSAEHFVCFRVDSRPYTHKRSTPDKLSRTARHPNSI